MILDRPLTSGRVMYASASPNWNGSKSVQAPAISRNRTTAAPATSRIRITPDGVMLRSRSPSRRQARPARSASSSSGSGAGAGEESWRYRIRSDIAQVVLIVPSQQELSQK